MNIKGMAYNLDYGESGMTILIHDLGEEYNTILKDSADLLIHADGQ
ncbi:MAG: hypothetical protein J6W46_06550 [Spirochaetaceae bacterium]|nr:hypothetical protein [Spirochaetaceae bacterium]